MNQELWRDRVWRGWGRASLRMAVTPDPPKTPGDGGGAVGTAPPPTAAPATAPPAGPTTRTTTIVNGRVTDHHVYLDKRYGDTMFWCTEDDQGYTLVFMNEGWPFEEPPQFIHVPAHSCSRVLTVLAGMPRGAYTYSVYTAGPSSGGPVPGQLTDPYPGPPDPPTMDVGP